MGSLLESIIRHIGGCLLVLLVLPYLLLKCVMMIYVILDAPPNFEGRPRKGDMLYEIQVEMTEFIKRIYDVCAKRYNE